MSESTENEMEKICAWAYERLCTVGHVNRKDFLARFLDPALEDRKKKKEENNLLSNWNRAIHAIYAILSQSGTKISKERSGLILAAKVAFEDDQSALSRYTTDRFQPKADKEAKQHIGKLIASFLAKPRLRGKTIFLGSGSTIFHVGLEMCEAGHQYDQRFVTVNIPLAAVWCEKKVPPVNKISIPGAVLDTQTFRFSTMPGPGWPLTVSIVGADGCVYDWDKEELVFYGNEESVATNTNLFVQNTRHSVLFCLTSRKLEMGFAENPNTGPPILPPKKGVIRVLVTDKCEENTVKAFEKYGWMIVTEDRDWVPVLGQIEKGEGNIRKVAAKNAL